MKRTIGMMLGLAIALASATAISKAKGPAYDVKGHYYETCGCAVSCPCATGEFLPTEMHCDAVAFLHFDKASVGKTKLDGINIAIVLKSPKGKKVMESFEKGEMDHFAIYLDDKATEDQKKALPGLLGALFGTKEIKGAKPPAFVPMTLTSDGETAQIDIGTGKLKADIVNIKIGETKLAGKTVPKHIVMEGVVPFPWMGKVTQGKSKAFHYADGLTKWDYKDRNAFFGEFATKGTVEMAAAEAPAKK